MAVAAVAGAGAVGAGVVTASTLAMISVGVTAVGMVTKSKTLMKIGGGLGLGSAGAAMMGLGSSAAGAALGAEGMAAIDGANIADVAGTAGAGQSAAVAPAAVPTTGLPESGALDVAADGSPMLAEPAPPSRAQGVVEPARSTPSGMESAAPEQAGFQAQPAPTAPSAPQGPAVAPTTDAGVTKSVADAGVKATGIKDTQAALDGYKKLQDGKSFFGSFGDSLGKMWNGLDASGKLAVGQTAAGLVKGVGEGAFAYMGKDDERKYQDRLQEEKRARLSQVPTLTPYARRA